MQLSSRIFGRKAPFDLGAGDIARFFQLLNFTFERLFISDASVQAIRAVLSMWVKRCLAEQYITESAWEAQWLLEYVKSARTLERQPRA